MSRKLTYKDYLKLPHDGNRYEILDGELWVNGSVDTKPQRVFRNLFVALEQHAESGRGEVSVVPAYIWFPDASDDTPSLLFIRADEEGSPDLAVKILTETTRRECHEKFGVQEYWIVDPEDDTIRILRLSGEKYERIIVGGNITSPLLPGFSVALKAIFAEPRYA